MMFLKTFMCQTLRFRVSRCSLHTSSANNFKVAVLGASGRIGQPLSMLLKRSNYIRELALYDVVPLVGGVAADLSHICKRPQVVAHSTDDAGLNACLKGAEITIITAGQPRSPGMTRSDLMSVNASITAPLIHKIALHAPQTMICLVTNPINSLVPMAAEIMQAVTHFDPRRLFGITTLDSIRASTFVANAKGISASNLHIPVMGGHSESTLIPVFSQAVPSVNFPPDTRRALTQRIQTAGTEIVEAKAGEGSATLSMAYATERFIHSLLSAMRGATGIVESAFVKSSNAPTEYFATPLILGEEGISSNMGVGKLIDFELNLLRDATPEIELNIMQGKEFAHQYLKTMNNK